MDLKQIDNYRSLFLNNTPLLDVRAPIEFDQGAFPLAQNFPIMNDEERESIGLKYKNAGQDEAIKLGHQLIQGEIKNIRVNHWEHFFNQYPEGILYCFRGGMRSKITQQWIYEQTGLIFPRVKGGYKAMRRFLIDELDHSVEKFQPIILGGRTGIGKTILLNKLSQSIDLEGLFHHRGSVFGKHVTPQPSQIDIENNCSIALLKFCEKKVSHLLFEDEAPNIGSRRIPLVLFNKMQTSPLIQLQASIEQRIDITFQEYITEALTEHQNFYGDEIGFNQWSEQLNISIDKIQRRLGGCRYKQLKNLLSNALNQHLKNDDKNFHKEWIKSLLVDYYDPMYDYQFSKKEQRVIFKGTHQEVIEFLFEKYEFNLE
ncbi:Selenophosphate-dependent tRNA 2-selenouridine synthase [hydrothermal vent metagenome]|uniref:Selenophosphate-dependent tRNA 2-selenouridine synthase n=1 Tax=hydrothermal vent metagenome TaxID=652676 RepID=A0A3B0X429_9ZZZZ